MSDIECLAQLDPTATMSTNKRKKIRKAKRKVVGYDPSEPEMCSNCAHFKNSLYATTHNEYFPPRCEKHLFEVERHAVCDHWEDKY